MPTPTLRRFTQLCRALVAVPVAMTSGCTTGSDQPPPPIVPPPPRPIVVPALTPVVVDVSNPSEFPFCGAAVVLRSWRNDYLQRPDSDQGVGTTDADDGIAWAIDCNDRTVSLRSWKGDFLHRPDVHQGVTTWDTGIGNRWTVERLGDKLFLRSWKGDYLHRPDQPSGVTTWHTGIGNEWSLEIANAQALAPRHVQRPPPVRNLGDGAPRRRIVIDNP